jgi:hypothetical protein
MTNKFQQRFVELEAELRRVEATRKSNSVSLMGIQKSSRHSEDGRVNSSSSIPGSHRDESAAVSKAVAATDRVSADAEDGHDAPTAAHEVGYRSVSQFSREYSRFFWLPPIRDVKALKNRNTVGAEPLSGFVELLLERRSHPKPGTALRAGTRSLRNSVEEGREEGRIVHVNDTDPTYSCSCCAAHFELRSFHDSRAWPPRTLELLRLCFCIRFSIPWVIPRRGVIVQRA